jgi:penicillin amidase
MIPLSKMPKIINPKQGYLINWNNKPVAEWNHGEAPLWGEANSLRPIEHLIKSKGRMTFDQIRGITEFIATDDIGAEVLKPYLLAAITNRASATRDDRIKEAERLLRAWDDHDVDDSVAKTIYDAWNQALRDMLFRDDFDDLRAIVPFHIFPILFGNNFLLHVLEGAESGVALSRDYLKCRSRDEVIVEALSKAIDELTRKDGPQMNLWRFKQGDINLKPLPSIPATTRGTYILAVELSKPYFLTTSILPPGQSENPRSPHYSDQREMAGYWRFKQMLYTPSQLEKALAADD